MSDLDSEVSRFFALVDEDKDGLISANQCMVLLTALAQCIDVSDAQMEVKLLQFMRSHCGEFLKQEDVQDFITESLGGLRQQPSVHDISSALMEVSGVKDKFFSLANKTIPVSTLVKGLTTRSGDYVDVLSVAELEAALQCAEGSAFLDDKTGEPMVDVHELARQLSGRH